MQRFASYPSLEGRSVLITGGGSGIGAALVEQFALQGARVAFLDVAVQASEELVEQLAGRCAHRPLFQRCDLTDIGRAARCRGRCCGCLWDADRAGEQRG